MPFENEAFLILIGVQGTFSGEQGLGEQIMNFYGGFFRKVKEIRNCGKVFRYVRYEQPLPQNGNLVFIGAEVDEIGSIPAGMVAWRLNGSCWEVIEQKGEWLEVSSRREIAWRWIQKPCDKGKYRVVGDFYVQNTQNGGSNPDSCMEDFYITANAYTDPDREIEDGDKVELAAYDPSWPGQYADFAGWLTDYLSPDVAKHVEHFGSTAIPGMPAKPIIDVMVEAASFKEARGRIIPLLNNETWEYWWYGNHMTFIKREKFMGRRTHHIHIAPRNHELWNRLAFRDYLRTHPGDAVKYAELKRHLAKSFEKDRERYTNAKGAFVREITEKALKHDKGGANE